MNFYQLQHIFKYLNVLLAKCVTAKIHFYNIVKHQCTENWQNFKKWIIP